MSLNERLSSINYRGHPVVELKSIHKNKGPGDVKRIMKDKDHMQQFGDVMKLEVKDEGKDKHIWHITF